MFLEERSFAPSIVTGSLLGVGCSDGHKGTAHFIHHETKQEEI